MILTHNINKKSLFKCENVSHREQVSQPEKTC